MRRIPRTPLRRFQFTNTEPICVFCQSRMALMQPGQRSFSTTRPQAEQKTTFLERTRRRIWGTDNPPGFDDPYTGRNFGDGEVGSQDINYEKEEWQRQVNEAPKHPEYKPADTWDGLEIVGGPKDFETDDKFSNFLGQGRITSPDGVRIALHRALVEVFTLISADLSLKKHLPESPIDPLLDGADLFKEVSITPSKDGAGATLQFSSDAHRREILEYMRTDTPPAADEREDGDHTDAMNAWAFNREEVLARGEEMFPISLRNPQVKFAVHKRLSQLIGRAVSDPLITKSNNVGDLYLGLMGLFMKQTKLHQEIQFGSANELTGLDNVVVYEKRQSPIDRERTKGRLKVINRELERQGLPLMGEKPQRH